MLAKNAYSGHNAAVVGLSIYLPVDPELCLRRGTLGQLHLSRQSLLAVHGTRLRPAVAVASPFPVRIIDIDNAPAFNRGRICRACEVAGGNDRVWG